MNTRLSSDDGFALAELIEPEVRQGFRALLVHDAEAFQVAGGLIGQFWKRDYGIRWLARVDRCRAERFRSLEKVGRGFRALPARVAYARQHFC
jgi:hypothetical protein